MIEQSTAAETKRTYVTPTLEKFGSMQELTAAEFLADGVDNQGGPYGSGVGIS